MVRFERSVVETPEDDSFRGGYTESEFGDKNPVSWIERQEDVFIASSTRSPKDYRVIVVNKICQKDCCFRHALGNMRKKSG